MIVLLIIVGCLGAYWFVSGMFDSRHDRKWRKFNG